MINIPEEKMVEHSNEYLLMEQYKLYVQLTDNVSNRRLQTNAFFLSIISGTLFLYPTIAKFKSDFGYTLLICFGFLGVVLCYTWFNLIRQYNFINKNRFLIIHKMEERLPFQCYTQEWNHFRKTKGYIGLTKIERSIPLLISIPYILLIFYSIYKIIFEG